MALIKCPSFPGYSVDVEGNVYSHRFRRKIKGQIGGTSAYIDYSRNNKLRQHKTKKGYFVVSAKHEVKGTRNYGVHQMVADAVLGPAPYGLEVRHLDGKPWNNVPNNLAYGTQQDNAGDRIKHGGYCSGGHHCGAKLTNAQAEKIRELRKRGGQVKILAEWYGVSVSTIESIIYNKSYV